MGWRFRRSVKLGPVRLNLSKSGLGWSVGNRFARIGKRSDGRIVQTVTLPGTGLSEQHTLGGSGNAQVRKSSGCAALVIGCAVLLLLGWVASVVLGRW
jgi:hypothetical protein